MSEFHSISEAEYEVMKVIWEHSPISTTEIVEQLKHTTTWSPKTIQTLILRLVKKGALTHEKRGRVFVYTPVFPKNEYLKQESKSFFKRFFNNTANSMLLNFIENDLISENDINELRNILNEKKEKGEK